MEIIVLIEQKKFCAFSLLLSEVSRGNDSRVRKRKRNLVSRVVQSVLFMSLSDSESD